MTTELTYTIPAAYRPSANQRLHWAREIPCERCIFVPTPDGACICRGDR